jgi:hypothetical protein
MTIEDLKRVRRVLTAFDMPYIPVHGNSGIEKITRSQLEAMIEKAES